LPQHNGSVYVHKSRNQWKESWLCLESNGKLTWKKKDAYEVKGVAYVDEILDHIEISGWSAKKCAHNDNATPFLINLPIQIRGSKSNKTLIVKSGADLDLWLDAFATVVGKWKLWRACKRKQAFRISRQKSMDERSVEQQLKYDELVEFYRITWVEFLAQYKNQPAEENEVQNGQLQNGTTTTTITQQFDNVERHGAIAKQQYATNGLANQGQDTNPPSYEYTEIATATKQQREVTTTTVVTVHQQVNGIVGNQNASAVNSEVLGQEDDGEELHL